MRRLTQMSRVRLARTCAPDSSAQTVAAAGPTIRMKTPPQAHTNAFNPSTLALASLAVGHVARVGRARAVRRDCVARGLQQQPAGKESVHGCKGGRGDLQVSRLPFGVSRLPFPPVVPPVRCSSPRTAATE